MTEINAPEKWIFTNSEIHHVKILCGVDIKKNRIDCSSVQLSAVSLCACHAVQYSAYNAMHCNVIQINAIKCNAMQCNEMPYNVLQCNALQYKRFGHETLSLHEVDWYSYFLQIFINSSSLDMTPYDNYFIKKFTNNVIHSESFPYHPIQIKLLFY